jgi:hypothetical protein
MVEQYINWLKDKTTLKQVGDNWVRITTPYLDRHNDCLQIYTKKHNLLQAMLAVNDLFFLASPMVSSLFYEDVTTWLDLHEIRYTPKVKFNGKSGYDHMFDFVIPKSKVKPERIVQTINNPSRDTAETIVFKWLDTRAVRPPQSRAFALLNDQNTTISQGVIDALKNYDTIPVLWSERDEIREELAA